MLLRFCLLPQIIPVMFNVLTHCYIFIPVSKIKTYFPVKVYSLEK
ncbi:hypothetical protein ymoll0001_15750 [Yersinia mollaretii ATCC 43969]|uniref:Uncharacterized protein n=1 Tax=Yersinia mollaretii (strain ATCC 43969 / DSM 18520 / CIP 103324 / CNY 7263 / WAIP 204) TaxID=349967 RepID=A0ABP2EIE7_YERMW|nr:hypothetical protein ymoll0001_15750 [Yersinia mollaretii ATCC 43969]